MSEKEKGALAWETDDGIVVGRLYVIPPEHRARLNAYANADGRTTLAEWMLFFANECGWDDERIDEYISDCIDDSKVDGAIRILWDATNGEYFPWGMDPWPEVETEEQFMAKIREWAQPQADSDDCGEITEEEAGWMLEMGKAALAHDGKRAHVLGRQLWERWYAPEECTSAVPASPSSARSD